MSGQAFEAPFPDETPGNNVQQIVPPPHSIEAEKAVLGAMLLSEAPQATHIAEQGLREGDFYRERHALIFAAMRHLHDAGEPIDTLTVVEHLRSCGTLEQAGGAAEIDALAGEVPAVQNIRKYGEIVKEHALLRRLLTTTYEVQAAVHQRDGKASQLIARYLDELHTVGEEAAAEAGLFPLLGVDDLAKLPPATYLVDGVIPAFEASVLFGPSGVGKTFILLDLCLCVATGFKWFGRPVQQGHVVYLAGEGAGGLHGRIAAWKAERGYTGTAIERNFHIVPEGFSLLDADNVTRLQRTLQGLGHVAVVAIDTLARYATGADENSVDDMGRWIENVDRLRRTWTPPAASITAHHTGKDTTRDERGSSAIRGAVACSIKLTGEPDAVRMLCKKQKDDEEFAPYALRLVPAHGSLVVRLGDAGDTLTEAEADVLAAVSKVTETQTATAARVIETSGRARGTVYKALDALTEAGLLEPRRVQGSNTWVPVSNLSPTVSETPAECLSPRTPLSVETQDTDHQETTAGTALGASSSSESGSHRNGGGV